MVAGRRRTRRANSISTASSKKAEGGARGRERPARRLGTKGRSRGSRQQANEEGTGQRSTGAGSGSGAACVGGDEAWLAQARYWLKGARPPTYTQVPNQPSQTTKPNQTLRARRRPPSDWAPLPSRSLATRQSPPLAAHAHGVLARLAPAPHPAPGPRRHARLRYPPPPRGRGP